MSTILEIKNFSQSYNSEVNAVNNISLSVEEGEIYGFVGHNGAGKSTTIKAIVGILQIMKGEINVAGFSVNSQRSWAQKEIAYVPDNPDLFEYMTGIGYLNFIADIFQLSNEERNIQIKKYADAFELTSKLGNLIQSYSHGMKQKIALIGAFIHKPKLLVLDEPFVGLDPKASSVLKQCMKELCQEGSAIFFSTHVLEVAEKLCNKIGIMNHGELILSGKVEDLIKEKSLEEIFLDTLKGEE